MRGRATPGQLDLSPLGGPAAGLSAVAYAFGGSVLFQYSNVVFLVGAAWLPWTLLAIHRMLNERRLVGVLAVGACLALTVLGGDPQSAYHIGLLGILYAVILRRAGPSGNDNDSRLTAGRYGTAPYSTTDAVVRLLASAVLAGLLAAVQIVPTWSWVAQQRSRYSSPIRGASMKSRRTWARLQRRAGGPGRCLGSESRPLDRRCTRNLGGAPGA